MGVVAVAVAVVAAYLVLKRPPDVHNPSADFKSQKPKKQKRRAVTWPQYGYNRARTRYLPAKGIKPPFRKVWRYTDRPLLEFPPVVAQSDSLGQGFGTSGAFYSTPAVAFGRVYAGNNDTRVYSFDRRDGTIAWTYSTGGCAYSGPAAARTSRTGPTVYIGSFDGNLYALNA
ncbi:MAG: PQQ-binding-like beta-propeller repeat protein [Solirubrobacterales bacterium]